MIPPVPLTLRLALSAFCILVSKAGFTLAGWITPELQVEASEEPVLASRRTPEEDAEPNLGSASDREPKP